MKKFTKCPKCKIGDLKPGAALQNTLQGCPDFLGSNEIVTISRTGPPKMISVYKCTNCGHSIKK